MPSGRCTVQGCSNKSNIRAGISLHRSPEFGSERDQWLRFVRTHRANFTPRGIFVVCSVHFEENCFERVVHVEGEQRRIRPHSIPTIWRKGPEKPFSARSRRKVRTSTCSFVSLLTKLFFWTSMHAYINDRQKSFYNNYLCDHHLRAFDLKYVT